MKKNVGIFLIFSLMICPLSFSAKNELTQMQEVVVSFNEVGHYFGACLLFYAALNDFSQKNNTSIPEITCKLCPQTALPCDQLIVKVQAKAMDKAIGAEDSIANEARKKMLSIYDEITKQLCVASLDDIRKFMAKVAQEEEIACEDCQKFEWQALGVSKSEK